MYYKLTHQLLNNALSIGRCMKLTPEDKLCLYPNIDPLYILADQS
jgi:hypothetical protein